jgi:hypothetical protein
VSEAEAGSLHVDATEVDSGSEVRKTLSWPEVGPTSAFYRYIPAGMRGPTCTFWANLTPFSLEARWGDMESPDGLEADALVPNGS